MNEAELVACVRAALSGAGVLAEVKMFGGLGFMLNGHLLAGASRRGLLVRVGSDRQPEALRLPGARPMVMRGRTMTGYVYVDPPDLDPQRVRHWLGLAIPYVRALPPKPAARRSARATPGRKSAAALPAKPRRSPAGKASARTARRARGRRAK
jgi:TfoX/Sxy family transcriptional regulator of competence genes